LYGSFGLWKAVARAEGTGLPMEQLLQSWPFRSALAVSLVATALLSSLIFNTLTHIHAPYIFFMAAVVVSAFLGRFLTGLLATILSIAVVSSFGAEPHSSLAEASQADHLRMAQFLVEGTLVSVFTGLLRSTRSLLFRQRWQRYGLIIPILLLAFILKLELVESLPGADVPYRFFYIAVLLVARCGGLGPALTATLVGGLMGTFFFADPHNSLHLAQREDALRLVGFLLESMLISFVGSTLFVVREQAEQHRQEIRRQQEQLAESERRYRLLVEGVRDHAVLLLDPQGGVTNWNSSAERILGLPGRAILGSHVATLARPDEAETLQALEQVGCSGGPEHWEWVGWLTRQDGKRLWAEEVITALRNNLQEIQSFSVVLRDLTERHQAAEVLRKTQEQLRQAQKLESIGRLASGVAHDFNNLILIISGYSEVLLGQLPPGDPLREPAQQLQQTVDRAAGLTRQLLTFSRGQVLNPVVLDLNTQVNDLGTLLRSLIGKTVRVVMALAPDLWTVRADRVQMEQVVMNLFVNARDAMPDGGELTMTTVNVMITREQVEPAEVPSGDWVVLAVADSGCGMDETVKARLFEPFFTTKKQGTGLGLSTVHGIVTQLGGRIVVASAPGQGSTFRVYLPRWQEAKIVPPARPVPVPTSRLGGESVLVVDDEASVRTLLRLVLKREGYDVLEADNAKDALTLVQQRAGAVDLLLTDVGMPGMNGVELARHLLRSYPKLPVLFLSAHSAEVLEKLGLSEQEIVLPKPFNLDTLVAQVRKMLDESVASKG
jgi:PAS domain S-box-containing protein